MMDFEKAGKYLEYAKEFAEKDVNLEKDIEAFLKEIRGLKQGITPEKNS
jgi:hypothetical protein